MCGVDSKSELLFTPPFVAYEQKETPRGLLDLMIYKKMEDKLGIIFRVGSMKLKFYL